MMTLYYGGIYPGHHFLCDVYGRWDIWALGCFLVPLFDMFVSIDSKSLELVWWSFKIAFCVIWFYSPLTHTRAHARKHARTHKETRCICSPEWTDGREIYGFMTHPLLVNARKPPCPWKIAAWPQFQLSAFMQLPWLPFKHTTITKLRPGPFITTKVAEEDTHLRREGKTFSALQRHKKQANTYNHLQKCLWLLFYVCFLFKHFHDC